MIDAGEIIGAKELAGFERGFGATTPRIPEPGTSSDPLPVDTRHSFRYAPVCASMLSFRCLPGSRKENHVRQGGYGVFGLVLLTMGLVACGPARISTVPEREFSYRASDGTAELLWDCTRTAAGEVRIEGAANNPFFPQRLWRLQKKSTS